MSKENKKNVKIKEIKKIVCIAFVAYGLLVILLQCIFFYSDVEYNIIPISLPVLLVILFVITNLPRFRIK